LLFRIDPEIEKIIEANHKNPEISGHADLDGPVRLLTGLASSLGLCRPGDVELIRVCMQNTMKSLNKIQSQMKELL